MKTMKNLVLMMGSLLLFSGCLKDDDNTVAPHAIATFINGYTAHPEVAFGLDGNTFYVGRYNSSGSFRLNTGPRVLNISVSGGAHLLDTNFTVLPWTYYSVFVYGSAEEPKVLLARDAETENLGNRTGIRFIHIANDAGAVNLYMNDSPVAQIANRPQETRQTIAESEQFIPADAGTHLFSVTDDQGNVLARSSSRMLNPGRYTTVVLLGTKDSDSHPLRLATY